MGRNRGRQWGDSVAAYGELSMAAVTQPGCRSGIQDDQPDLDRGKVEREFDVIGSGETETQLRGSVAPNICMR
jgi:hypothetical protein